MNLKQCCNHHTQHSAAQRHASQPATKPTLLPPSLPLLVRPQTQLRADALRPEAFLLSMAMPSVNATLLPVIDAIMRAPRTHAGFEESRTTAAAALLRAATILTTAGFNPDIGIVAAIHTRGTKSSPIKHQKLDPHDCVVFAASIRAMLDLFKPLQVDSEHASMDAARYAEKVEAKKLYKLSTAGGYSIAPFTPYNPTIATAVLATDITSAATPHAHALRTTTFNNDAQSSAAASAPTGKTLSRQTTAKAMDAAGERSTRVTKGGDLHRNDEGRVIIYAMKSDRELAANKGCIACNVMGKGPQAHSLRSCTNKNDAAHKYARAHPAYYDNCHEAAAAAAATYAATYAATQRPNTRQ